MYPRRIVQRRENSTTWWCGLCCFSDGDQCSGLIRYAVILSFCTCFLFLCVFEIVVIEHVECDTLITHEWPLRMWMCPDRCLTFHAVIVFHSLSHIQLLDVLHNLYDVREIKNLFKALFTSSLLWRFTNVKWYSKATSITIEQFSVSLHYQYSPRSPTKDEKRIYIKMFHQPPQ